MRIDSNVLITSGSIVMRDREPNFDYAGVTARKIGMFEDLNHPQ